jgi:hypothetical protein
VLCCHLNNRCQNFGTHYLVLYIHPSSWSSQGFQCTTVPSLKFNVRFLDQNLVQGDHRDPRYTGRGYACGMCVLGSWDLYCKRWARVFYEVLNSNQTSHIAHSRGKCQDTSNSFDQGHDAEDIYSLPSRRLQAHPVRCAHSNCPDSSHWNPLPVWNSRYLSDLWRLSSPPSIVCLRPLSACQQIGDTDVTTSQKPQ